MFYALKRKPNPGSLFFHEFLPGMVESGENGTFLVEFPNFHENGWNLMKMALFTPKPPSGRHRPQKPLNSIVFYNASSDVRPPGPVF